MGLVSVQRQERQEKDSSMSDTPSKKPVFEAGMLTYSQENDCCDDSTIGQYIEIESHDGGAGKYFTIKTERWAFDNAKQLVAMIEDAERRLK
jgi:hypothetical protein